jgi:extradiol dioxygenase family protein
VNSQPTFHLAFPVTDLEATRRFFTRLFDCRIGREDARWMDFDFYGHQITAHLCERMPDIATNAVDGSAVPVSHFGVVLEWGQWHTVAERLLALNVEFLIEPHIRFPGRSGEQATLFLRDPSGNGIELKAFREPGRLFLRD